MNFNEQLSFEDVLNLIRRLDDSSIASDGTTTQFLEVRKATSGDGVNVNGNASGLVHLARLVLEVAGKGFAGAHQHFDQAGDIDVCELPLVIGFKPAEWDVK